MTEGETLQPPIQPPLQQKISSPLVVATGNPESSLTNVTNNVDHFTPQEAAVITGIAKELEEAGNIAAEIRNQKLSLRQMADIFGEASDEVSKMKPPEGEDTYSFRMKQLPIVYRKLREKLSMPTPHDTLEAIAVITTKEANTSEGNLVEGRPTETKPSLVELAEKYHIPSDRLRPEEYMALFEPFLPEEVHQRLVDDLHLNPENLARDINEVFKQTYNNSQLLLVGWEHLISSEHRKAIEMLSSIADKEDMLIALEYHPDSQQLIDHFLETGKFRDSDNSSLYSKIYEAKYIKELEVIPEELQGTFFDSDTDALLEVYEVLEFARANGIPVYNFDKYHEFEHPQRDEGMLELLSDQVQQGKKVIALMGGVHVKANSYDTGSSIDETVVHHSSLGFLAKQRYEGKLTTFAMEAGNARMAYKFEGAEGVESVLFKAYENTFGQTENTALQINENVFIEAEQNLYEAVGVDYYIPIFKTS